LFEQAGTRCANSLGSARDKHHAVFNLHSVE
jgi:hypothetical protein